MNNKWLIVLVALAISACDSGSSSDQHMIPTLTGSGIQRSNNLALINQGWHLYEKHCAHCHGPHAEGDTLWRKPGVDGYYPPPPLDGSGHSWHHPRSVLHNIIKHGSPVDERGLPLGKMPAWGQVLNDQEIEVLIVWFQSLWPDPVYAIWYDREQRARGE
jgi:mono/diheme cytochrome c family protein